MKRLIHKGIRPTSPIQLSDFKRKEYFEEMPDGRRVWWTKKLLNSGCDGETYDPQEMRGCLYCPWCKEWFHKREWIDEHSSDQ